MTSKEWNTGIEFLEGAEFGQWVEYFGRVIEVGDMIAGRFEMYDKNGEFCGATDETWRAMEFLKSGKILVSRF